MREPLQAKFAGRGRTWRKTFRNTLYFGVPILVALSSAIFPISTFLRQAMVGFMLIWFVAGSWMFASSK